uniref:Uncharacterized protein n=1 Tax=Ditylenchus dipsaci TaxID=166011 RepID=A0A915DIZ7_9BILA
MTLQASLCLLSAASREVAKNQAVIYDTVIIVLFSVVPKEKWQRIKMLNPRGEHKVNSKQWFIVDNDFLSKFELTKIYFKEYPKKKSELAEILEKFKQRRKNNKETADGEIFYDAEEDIFWDSEETFDESDETNYINLTEQSLKLPKEKDTATTVRALKDAVCLLHGAAGMQSPARTTDFPSRPPKA